MLASVHVSLQRAGAIVVTVVLLLLVLELVRRKHLSERYAILWLLASVVLLILAAWKGLLTSLASDAGISYPPSALFAVAIGLIIVLLLHFSLAVSRLSDQNKILAQRLGLLQQRVEGLEHDAGEPAGQGKRHTSVDALAAEEAERAPARPEASREHVEPVRK